MLMEIKQPRFECLSCEFYQGSHTFQQGLPHLSTSPEGFLVGLGRHNPHQLRRTEAGLGWYIALHVGHLEGIREMTFVLTTVSPEQSSGNLNLMFSFPA